MALRQQDELLPLVDSRRKRVRRRQAEYADRGSKKVACPVGDLVYYKLQQNCQTVLQLHAVLPMAEYLTDGNRIITTQRKLSFPLE